jgi:hypothetical protein
MSVKKAIDATCMEDMPTIGHELHAVSRFERFQADRTTFLFAQKRTTWKPSAHELQPDFAVAQQAHRLHTVGRAEDHSWRA